LKLLDIFKNADWIAVFLLEFIAPWRQFLPARLPFINHRNAGLVSRRCRFALMPQRSHSERDQQKACPGLDPGWELVFRKAV
jgi:hypothetical protein